MTEQPRIIHPELERRAREEDDDALLEVVVELHNDPAEQPSAGEMRESFSRAKKPVADAISGLGGKVTDDAWINYTLRALVPASGLRKVSTLDEVRALDLPRQITADDG